MFTERLRQCFLSSPKLLGELQAALREQGEEEHEFFCSYCRDHHLVRADALYLQQPGGSYSDRAKASGLPPIPANAGPNWCRWHGTSAPKLTGCCAWCQTKLHVHADAIGEIRSGKADKGFLVVKCQACHRGNGVTPLDYNGSYDRKLREARKGGSEVQGAILVNPLEDGRPVIQKPLLLR